jgi:hypothetical protein
MARKRQHESVFDALELASSEALMPLNLDTFFSFMCDFSALLIAYCNASIFLPARLGTALGL